jgi:hypothetical protein
MRTRPLRLLALAFALAAAPALARGPNVAKVPLESVTSLQVEGEVDIDAAGNVVAFRLDPLPPESVRPALERTIRGWHFVPRVDGAVVQAQTLALRLSLGASEVDGRYLAKIENVWLSARAAKEKGFLFENDTVAIQAMSLRPPSYPSGLQVLGIAGKVLVGVRLGTSGKVEDAVVVQSALMDAQDLSEGARRALKYFEDASLDGARRWRFAVTPRAGVPTPEDLTVLVPIYFLPDTRELERDARWRSIVRTQRTPAPWLPAADERSRLGVADVGNDDSVPEAADVRLAADPSGKVL